MSLEKIIRPFQTREVTPPRIALTGQIAIAQAVDAETVKIVIGKSPGLKSVTGSETIDVSYYAERWMKERRRAVGQPSLV